MKKFEKHAASYIVIAKLSTASSDENFMLSYNCSLKIMIIIIHSYYEILRWGVCNCGYLIATVYYKLY